MSPSRHPPSGKTAGKVRSILVLNGPNLNLIGTREPDIYGHDTLADVEAAVRERAAVLGLAIDFRQSNHEGELIDWLHDAGRKSDLVILNAGGLTHTSVALHDAIRSIQKPVIEVHLSNPQAREPFRHVSYVGMAAVASICGFGKQGYLLALDAAANL